MSDGIDLTACIVNWNGRELLRDLLRSLGAARDRLAVETIVVDNASTDGSADMVEREFPRVTVIRNERNLGFAKANNLAAALARGRLLLFLNNDVLVPPGALGRLVRFIDEDLSIAAVGPCLVGRDGRAQHTGRQIPRLRAFFHRIFFLRWTGLFRAAYRSYRRDGFDPDRSGPVDHLSAAALLVRRQPFVSCGRWDEGFEFGLEDLDLSVRLGRHGKIYYLADVKISHWGGVSSKANREYVYRGYECGYARYLRKHHGAMAALVYKTLVTADMPVRLLLLAGECVACALLGKGGRARRLSQQLAAASGFLAKGMRCFWSC